MTLVPLRIYFNDRGMAKLQLALAKGKNAPDKRADHEGTRLEPPEAADSEGRLRRRRSEESWRLPHG